MAPLPTIADTFRCAFNHFAANGSAVSILHIRKATATASQIAADIQTASTGHNIFDEMHTGWTTPSVSITPLDGHTAALDFAVTGLDGSGAGDELPAYAIVISLKTTQRGSRGRGRCFIGPIGETVTQGGKILTADATTIAGIWNGWANALVTAGSQLVVASYLHADAHNVSSLRCDIPLGVQRRRQDRLVR